LVTRGDAPMYREASPTNAPSETVRRLAPGRDVSARREPARPRWLRENFTSWSSRAVHGFIAAMETAARVVSTSILRPAVAMATEAGVDAHATLARFGLTRRDLESDDVYRSATTVLRAWCDLAEASGDPVFGLRAAKHLRPDRLAVLGGVLRLSNDLYELAERLTRFQRLVGDAWAMHLDAHAGHVTFRRAALVAAGEERHLVERASAIVVLELRRFARLDIDPRAVAFRHEAPADRSMHHAIFRAPIHFDADANELVYDARTLRRPVEYGDRAMARTLERVARAALATLPDGEEWIGRVRRTVIDLLPDGAPTLRTVAERLHSSERTVQRYLSSQHTSLRRIVDVVRRELAAKYLADTALALDEIAFLLGYRDAGTFFRAFRAWGVAEVTDLRTPARRAHVSRALERNAVASSRAT
jgi:AraC-like DNA-binding protein